MKNCRYGWFIGLCMFALVSIFLQTDTVYADTADNKHNLRYKYVIGHNN